MPIMASSASGTPATPVSAWQSYCGDSIWDNQLAWNTSTPRLTLCFRKTILVWLPPIYLTLFLPMILYSFTRSKEKFQWNRYNRIRMALSVLMLIDLLVLLAITVYDHEKITENQHYPVYDADVINAFIRVIYSIILCGLFWMMVTRGQCTSGVIWSYLGLTLFCNVIELASNIVDQNEFRWRTDLTLFINCLLTASLFIQSFISDSGKNDNDSNNEKKKYQQHQKNDRKAFPKMSASFFSRLTFSWYSSLTYIGWKRPIVLDDIWNIRTQDSSFHNYQLFQKKLEEFKSRHEKRREQQKQRQIQQLKQNQNENQEDRQPFKVSCLKVIWASLSGYFLTGAFFKIFNDVLIFINPMIMKKLINFISDYEEPTWHGYIYALGLFWVTIGQIFSINYYFNRMMLFGLRVRTQLIGAIYRKALKLSNSSRSKFTTGQIVNLMAVDAQNFVLISQFINLLWSAPFQIIVALWLLWLELGVSVLGGFFFMIIMIPINGYLTNVSKRLQVKQMKLKDERVKAMNEILSSIKIIKLYSWEKAFIDKIQKIRKEELANLRRINYLMAILQALFNLAPFLVSFITFTIYVCIDENNQLTAAKAFVSLSLFNILRFPLVMLPNLVTLIIMTSVSVKRLNAFLSCTELTNYIKRNKKQDEHCLKLDNCSFSWFNRYDQQEQENKQDPQKQKKHIEKPNNNNVEQQNQPQSNGVEKNDQSKPFLEGIDMKIKEKSFVAIVGNVGSGKSSLLNAILGNMELTNGTINIADAMAIAYTPQEAWIQNNTLRDNIVFDQPFDEQFYRKVCRACSLVQDFTVLPGGDLTEIGEKGINLSGGQKQRVSLARACYNNADIYLLDDPLSAVDSHVGQHIFENMISSDTGILRDKTRIMVTNNLSVLPHTDQIFVLKDGRIIESGSYQYLMDQNQYFANLINQFANQNKEKEDEKEDDKKKEEDQKSLARDDKDVFNFKINKLVEKELAQTGQVHLGVYVRYMKAITIVWCVAILVNYGLSQTSNVGSGLWLAEWSKRVEENTAQDNTMYYLLIYGIIGMGQGVFISLGWLSLTKGTLKAARYLHDKMLNTIFRSTMAFFDVTPLGRILNRFSKDVDVCDSNIQGNIRILMTCLFSTVAILITISIKLPIFLIIILPVVICFYVIQRLYISTARQLKRLESISKSPVYSHFSETLSGVNTIRAYDVCEQFTKKNDDHVDINNSCNIAIIIANRWLSIRLEIISNFIVLFSAIFAVIYRDKMDPSSVGLIISYALTTTQNLNYLVRSTTDLETNIVGVERILEYTDLPVEADWEIEETKPPKNWPEQGKIEFIDYETRYREGLDLVLKGITFTIEPCEKIGIVGRTGAGKSSLTLALFRLIEPAGGCIKIDSIDISTLGLHDLRKRLTIIPQDPVLFSGTIRNNLDPFNSFSDDDIWRCLELAHLKDFVRTLKGDLNHEISESGSNLSVGQRQLVCLARALLRKTKILILDEATAAVDMETDSLIQKTIRKSFDDCTILTIAHRLNTIMDSDRILVLDDGRVAEYDSPANLLANPETIFYSMTEASGLIQSNQT